MIQIMFYDCANIYGLCRFYPAVKLLFINVISQITMQSCGLHALGTFHIHKNYFLASYAMWISNTVHGNFEFCMHDMLKSTKLKGKTKPTVCEVQMMWKHKITLPFMSEESVIPLWHSTNDEYITLYNNCQCNTNIKNSTRARKKSKRSLNEVKDDVLVEIINIVTV